MHTGAPLLGNAIGSRETVRVFADGQRTLVAIGVACPPVRARTHGRRLVARWPPGRCGLTSPRVTLKLALDADCQLAQGRVRRAGTPPVTLRAARCAPDGAVSAEAGEECAGDDACGSDRHCLDCRCVPRVDFARDILPIFQGCMTVACHEGPTGTGIVDLLPEQAFLQLRARSARTGTCAGQPIVVPGDPDASVFWKRVGGEECGGRMPLGSSLLPTAELDAIRAWIAQGATER